MRYLIMPLFLLVSVGGGLLIGALNIPGEWYAGLVKPVGTPPDWLFAPVWTLLYVLIGLAGARVFRVDGATGPLTLLWAGQMGLNFIWSPIVFSLNDLGLGIGVILLLWAVIVMFIFLALRRDRIAALMFAPYLAWVSYASYLNVSLWVLNSR